MKPACGHWEAAMKTHIARNVVAAMIAAVACGGLVPPVRAGDRQASPPYDASVLSEIAENVRRRALTGPKKLEPVSISPSATAAPAEFEGEDIEIAPDAPFAHSAPAQEGITVATPPGAALVGKTKPEPGVGYQSNSSRGRKHLGSGLSFSSGILAPSSGLDPSLTTQALATRGRPFVYGFVRLNTPRTEALEQHLASFGVQLLGPHDDHHKARMPVGSLAALAAAPEIAWLGVSPPELKLDEELAAVRGPQGKKAGVGPATRSRSSSTSSKATRRDSSDASSKPSAPRWPSTIPSSSPIARWRPSRSSRRSRPSTSCSSSSSSG